MAILKDPNYTYDVIGGYEGFNPNAYWDVNGYAIGFGNHQYPDGSYVQKGDTIDYQGAIDARNYSIDNVYAQGIADRVGANWDNLSVEEQSALTSLSYNYGPNSDRLDGAVAAAQAGDRDGLANSIDGLAGDNGGINAARRASEADMVRNGTKPSQAGKTGQGGTTRRGGGGGGAGCMSAGSGISGNFAAAGLTNGAGMGMNQATQAMAQQVSQSPITGAMGGAMATAGRMLSGGGAGGILGGMGGIGGIGGMTSMLTSISGAGFQALSQIGAAILPSLTGVIPQQLTGIISGALSTALRGGTTSLVGGSTGGTLTNNLGNLLGPLTGIMQGGSNNYQYPNAMQQFASYGGLSGTIQQVGANMVGNSGTGSLSNFMTNISMASAMGSIANNIVAAASEGSALRFGTGTNGLGTNFRNNNDVISYGVTSISRNVPGVANDFINLGNFETKDLLRLQQPGYVAKQIICAGLGSATGLIDKLISAGIPLGGIDSPLNDIAVQNVMNSINDNNALGAVSSVFNLRVKIENLGQLTNLEHMCPVVYSTSASKNFKDLGQHFISLGITRAETFKDIGMAFSQIDAGLDLNHYSQMSTPYYPEAANQLIRTFGFGGGSLGEITMADFLGTAAGYVHNDTLPHIINANSKVSATPEGQELQRRIGILDNLVSNRYFVPGSPPTVSPSTPGTQDCIIIRDTLISYNNTGTPKLRTYGSTSLDSKVYYSMDEAVLDVIDYIEEQLTVIKNHPDPEIQKALIAGEKAHSASCAQILKENHMMKTYDIDLFQKPRSSPLNAYMFSEALPYHGMQTGYGQIGDYIERVASNNIYGDAIKASMRMGRNADALKNLGMDTTRFNLPHSQYYRDPQTFYMNAYTGKLPVVPDKLKDQILPKTPADIYVEMRNRVLDDNGYDPTTMLPAQADETYYDLQWKDCSVDVRQYIGLSALQQALNRNVKIVGRNMYIRNLNRGQTLFGVINNDGLALFNNDVFLRSLLDILNKILYGNIGTTKYDNPFETDQMAHGFHELLNQVTPVNIRALTATKLGSIAAKDLLDKIDAVFITLVKSGTTDTSGVPLGGKNSPSGTTEMDRNNVSAWGGTGPDGETIIPPVKPM